MVRSSTRDSCTNQSECGSTQEEGGATESCTSQSGRGEESVSIQDRRRGQQTAADPHREGGGAREVSDQ